MMDRVGPRTWRLAAVCVLGWLSLTSAQVCDGTRALGNSTAIEQFLTSLAPCSEEWTGNITIGGFKLPQATNQLSLTSLDLDQLAVVRGSLTLTNIRVKDGSSPWNLNATALHDIQGTLFFEDLDQFEMPDLYGTVNSIVFQDVTFPGPAPTTYWSGLTELTSLSFTSTGVDSIGPFGSGTPIGIYGSDPSTVASFTAVDNMNLQTIDMTDFSTSLIVVDIRDNNKNLAVTLPPSNSVSLMVNISGVNDLNAEELSTLGETSNTSTLQTISGNYFQTLSLPKLEYVWGALAIENNSELNTLEIGMLQSASSLAIANNNQLRDISLDSLHSVDDSLYLSGPIDSINAPNAKDIAGTVTIESSGNLDCSQVGIRRSNGGTVTCRKTNPSPTAPGQTAPASASSGPTDSDSDSSSGGGGLSTGAKIGIGVGVGVGVPALIAAALFFWCCTRRNSRRSPRSAAAGEYYMTETKGAERSPARYTKVPATSGSAEYQSSEEPAPAETSRGFHDRGISEDWSPPEQRVPNTDGRVELEEQQGMRHEMDARSLDGLDEDDDRVETRSLEDIEATHHR